MEKLEKILNDVLNAGIAIFRTGEESLNKTISDLQKSFNELKERGSTDTSEAASKLRSKLDEVIQNLNDLSSKAEGSYKQTLEKVESNYKDILLQVEKLLPKDQLDAAQKNINDLMNTIREKMDSVKAEAEKTETKDEPAADTETTSKTE
ncbi:MAG: hypothetical protein OEZ34_14590 [Spirochaetia bacterium]|nr:hypothetical protein [Spirochaetia bacterium]